MQLYGKKNRFVFIKRLNLSTVAADLKIKYIPLWLLRMHPCVLTENMVLLAVIY